jgi:hypothetical protein
MGLQQVLFRKRTIALQGAFDRIAEERRNDRTRAVIDRRYKRGTCRAERELEKKNQIAKTENNEKKRLG